MNAVLIIVIATCAALITVVLTKPSISVNGHNVSVYWAVPLIGAIILTACSFISPGEIINGLTANTAINPIKILTLFLSMTFLSVYLDEAGFFKYLANATLKKANTNQKALFIYLYIIVSVLTVFTSNDIIILTFTPFICYFSKSAKIDPTPYLFAEFVAANTWSMLLIIGNPTNVYLATSDGIDFLHYASVMALPTLFGGVTAFVLMYILFRKKLKIPFSATPSDIHIDDKASVILGLVHLILCTLLLTVASYIGLEMWLITLSFAVSLIVSSIVLHCVRKRRSISIAKCLRRVPWELVPFVLSMFVLVLTLNSNGITHKIAESFGNGAVIFKYGIASFIVANLINNIPMSVLFSSVVNDTSQAIVTQATYSSIIGSNICAFFTPIGALAGIMWSGILKQQHIKFSFLSFIKRGIPIADVTLIASLLGLMLRLG